MQSQWASCSLHSFAHKLNPHSINTIFVKQDETNWPKITRPNMDILISNGNKKCFHRKNELSESQICLLFISFMDVFEKKEWKQDRRTEEILTASFGSCNIPTINGRILFEFAYSGWISGIKYTVIMAYILKIPGPKVWRT